MSVGIYQDAGIRSGLRDLTETMGKIMKNQETVTDMLLNIDGTLIRFVENPTMDQMMMAVKQNGMAIQYILPANQTKEMKEEAIKSNPISIEYVYKPTYEMWINAVSTEYVEGKRHPVEMVKDLDDSGFPDRIATVYCSFIDTNPDDFDVIKEDITGIPSEDIVWAYIATEYPYKGYFKACPIKIKEKIIDCVIESCPQLLEDCPESFWTGERTLKYLDSCPLHINTVIENRPDIDPIDWYKMALDRVYKRADVLSIMFSYPKELKTLDNMKVLLETKSRYQLISYMCGFDAIQIEGLPQYIVGNFRMEDLVDNVPVYRIRDCVNKLPFFEKIKYTIRMKRCVNERYNGKYISDVIHQEEDKMS